MIEAISCRVSLPAPSPYLVFPALLLVPATQIGGGATYSVDHTLPLQKTFSTGSNDYFAGAFPLKIAVPGPGSGGTYPISVQAQGSGGASPVLGITCSVNGHLVSN